MDMFPVSQSQPGLEFVDHYPHNDHNERNGTFTAAHHSLPHQAYQTGGMDTDKQASTHHGADEVYPLDKRNTTRTVIPFGLSVLTFSILIALVAFLCGGALGGGLGAGLKHST